jgi:ribonuclease III
VKDPLRLSTDSNERLEFLGDAILGSVVAEYLFQRYVTRDEGFLTEMRSKIVNRTSLNELAVKLGLDTRLVFDRSGNTSNRSIYGNALEAFVGAMYLDVGYGPVRQFIVRKILGQLLNLDELAEQEANHKSKLMEFVQRNRLEPLRYEVVGERGDGHNREYTVVVKLGEEVVGQGTDIKKKFAEQKASEAALRFLTAPKRPIEPNRNQYRAS